MNPDVVSSQAPPQEGIKVFLIGSQGSGKTCFLGGLALHTEATRQSSFDVIGLPDADESDANASQAFLNEVGITLRSRNWPLGTVRVSMLRYELRYTGFISELTVVDYPGEEMRTAMHSLAPNSINRFAETLREATHLLVLMDPMVDLRINSDNEGLDLEQEKQLDQRLKAPINALLWCLSQEPEARPPHICLVITKADQIEGMLDPERGEWLRSKVLTKLKDRLEGLAQDEIDVFAISSVGAVTVVESVDGDGQLSRHTIPGDAQGMMEPLGYERLFDWIFSRQLREMRRRKMAVVAACAAVFLIVAAYFGWREFSAIRALNDEHLPVFDRITAFGRVWTTWGRRAAHRFLGAELETLTARLAKTNRFEECEPLLKDLDTLTTAADKGEREHIETLKQRVAARQRELEFQGIKAMPGGPARENRLRLFASVYPRSGEAKDAKLELDKTVDARMAKQRREIAGSYPLQTLPDFAAKATAMEKFVEEFGDKVSEREDILKAARIARRLADTNGQFQIVIRGFSGLSKPRYHLLEISVGKSVATSPENDAKETTKDTERTVNWKPGDTVRVAVKVDVAWVGRTWVVPAASQTVGPLSIVLLGQGEITLEETADAKRVPWLVSTQARISIRGFDAGDWKLARQYIHPGDLW
jgi:hypothetical protein